MKVRIKRLSENAIMPKKAHTTDAGFDLYCTETSVDWAKQEFLCHTGIAFEIPEGHAGLIFPRSSIANKPLLLHNSVGVIDSNYRGEVTAKFIITDAREFLQNDGGYHSGDRICQMIILSPILILSSRKLRNSRRRIEGQAVMGAQDDKIHFQRGFC